MDRLFEDPPDPRVAALERGEAIVCSLRKQTKKRADRLAAWVDPLAPWALQRGLLVYIGRGMPGWPESPFHNPFLVHVYGRDEAIRRYCRNLEGRSDLLALLPTLAGKALGCWCWPEPCHGDVLCELVALGRV